MKSATVRVRLLPLLAAVGVHFCSTTSSLAQQDSLAIHELNDSVSIRLVDVDLRAAAQALARYLDRPVVFGSVPGARVTLETPAPVPRKNVAELLRALLTNHGLELLEDSAYFRITTRAVEQRPDLAGQRQTGTGDFAGAELFVIRLRHARAADVAATVNALYGRASALGERGVRPSSLGDELRRQQLAPLAGPASEQPQGSTQPIRHAELRGDVTIVPDSRTNSLLIRSSKDDFELIEAAVNELDVRPLQALIEVLVVEARKDRSFSLGVSADLPPNKVGGTANTTVSGSTTGLGLSDLVLRVMNLGGVDLDLTLRAAAARGDVKIVSRPVVLAANNEEAEILVGSQRPFVQITRALPTDAAVRDQVVQYKEVGTRLAVRPTISSDGYVQLTVLQEVNSATSETQFNAPVISTRTLRTELLIRDGQTVVLGGLTDKQQDRNQQGVPILSSIPLVGGLFGSSGRRTTETELLLFLTPRVIGSDDDANRLTEPLKKRAERLSP